MVDAERPVAEDRQAMSGTRGPLSTQSIVRRYYGVWLCYCLAGGFLGGVYPLFLRSRGLSQLEMNIVLGCLLRGLSFALYFLSHTYALFLVAEAIDAVGTTFCNGAVDAWAVDGLDEAGFEGPKHGLFSRISQLSSLG